ncbi:hypothetical protein [Nocardioides sp. GXQ0305]|uniref:hypothetical protein n=1 Tax=Nocardioides sp. GXQ0305 TaxID=3423912 RepID=UPI003D7EB831
MRRGGPGALSACLVAAALLAGCSGEPSSPEQPPPESAPTVASEQQVERLLDRRARAILADRRADFVATTVPGPDRRRQLVAFEALGELPVARASYDITSVDEVSGRGVTRVSAQLLVRLEGFDPRPVPASHVLELQHHEGGWRVLHDRTAPSQVVAAPWTLDGARVRTGEGVIVVLDRRSADQGDRLLRLAAAAREATESYVPYPRRQGVVLLAPSTTETLRDDGFGSDTIDRLGGVAREVEDRRGDVVADRVVLVPAMLRQPDDVLLTLIRHEFAHVAIGQRDRRMPLWIVEGLAEWASWRGDPSFSIATSAVRAAESAEGITRMPSDVDFRDEGAGRAYGVAWFAMRWLETFHDPRAPYTLLDRVAAEKAFRDREVSRLLESEYGVTTDELARESGELIADTFEAS